MNVKRKAHYGCTSCKYYEDFGLEDRWCYSPLREGSFRPERPRRLVGYSDQRCRQFDGGEKT